MISVSCQHGFMRGSTILVSWWKMNGVQTNFFLTGVVYYRVKVVWIEFKVARPAVQAHSYCCCACWYRWRRLRNTGKVLRLIPVVYFDYETKNQTERQNIVLDVST
ncbi:unnamed protein product [Laminaria digitata]